MSEANKSVVQRFNSEVIEQGSAAAAKELMADDFVNRTAAPGFPSGPEGMTKTFNELLRPGLPDLRVEIHRQVAEGDFVTTHKTLRGTHTGTLMGIPPTGREVAITVIDMVRIANGKYVEHWGVNTLPTVLASLRQ